MKRHLRRLRDRALQKIGLVRISTLPMRDFSISYHSPPLTAEQRLAARQGEWEVHKGSPYDLLDVFAAKRGTGPAGKIEIEGTLRGGRRVMGELKDVQPEGISQ